MTTQHISFPDVLIALEENCNWNIQKNGHRIIVTVNGRSQEISSTVIGALEALAGEIQKGPSENIDDTLMQASEIQVGMIFDPNGGYGFYGHKTWKVVEECEFENHRRNKFWCRPIDDPFFPSQLICFDMLFKPSHYNFRTPA